MGARSNLAADGFAVIDAVLTESQCCAVDAALTKSQVEGVGTRNILAEDWCASVAADLRHSDHLRDVLDGAVAVQCTYFDKSPESNWLVAIHQDLSIPVKKQIDHPALRGWARKEGGTFVQSPPEVLDQLVAVRLHLDDSGRDNGPLRVVPGSHRYGRVSESAQPTLRTERGEVECLVARGGVIAMKPMLLHASSKSTGPNPRRVLHYLYGPIDLPMGLEWARAV